MVSNHLKYNKLGESRKGSPGFSCVIMNQKPIAAMIKQNYKTPRAESFPVEPERSVCQSLDSPDLEGWNNDEEIVW